MVSGYCDEKFTEAREVFSKSITSFSVPGSAVRYFPGTCTPIITMSLSVLGIISDALLFVKL